MKQLLSSGFRSVLRPEAEMLLRLRSPNDDTAKVRTKLREAGLRPTRTRIALNALLFSKVIATSPLNSFLRRLTMLRCRCRSLRSTTPSTNSPKLVFYDKWQSTLQNLILTQILPNIITSTPRIGMSLWIFPGPM